MTHRTCDADGCERPHQARGLCSSHYATWHRHTRGRRDATFIKTCIMCGAPWTTRREVAKYCSVQCKGEAYRRVSKLPADHPVSALIAAAKADAKESARIRRLERDRSDFSWRTERQCPGCAGWFTPLYTPNAVCCTERCSKKMARQRRRAREAGARGTFTWSEFMRIARKFNYCCAYCGDKPDRLDPDHVVPLSRGGSNTPSNLLPACLMCNSTKGAMTLREWEEWLTDRGKPARRTRWTAGDPRYSHLTDALLISSAA